MSVRVFETGAVVEEPVYGEATLRWCYDDPLGRALCELALSRPWASRLYGHWMARPQSRARIAPFVATYGIAWDEIELPPGGFASFAAFFERRLRPGARPFPADPAVLAAPADGRVRVYPALPARARLPVKGVEATLGALLGDEEAARPFEGGAAMVVRLAVQDYHRFHFPCAGTAGPARAIAGRCHSVGPIALARVPDAYVRNRRMLTLLDTPAFGRIAYLEVGALCVGAIHQAYRPGPVASGQEKGHFSLGGSTLVLAFEPGRVAFTPALAADAAAGLEVYVRAGTAVGSAR